jgi:hypothetical protein
MPLRRQGPHPLVGGPRLLQLAWAAARWAPITASSCGRWPFWASSARACAALGPPPGPARLGLGRAGIDLEQRLPPALTRWPRSTPSRVTAPDTGAEK